MTDHELLSAIANMINKNNKAIFGKMDSLEQNLRVEIQKTNLKIDSVEQTLESKINLVEQNLQAQIHKINLKLENDIEPRLYHIEECYLSTYDRYKVELGKMDKLQIDIEVMQDVIREHGQAINTLTA